MSQAPATNLGTWPATSTSHTHHRYTAAQPKPGRISVARQPQLPVTGHPAAALAPPKPTFQRSASRSLGPAVAAGQAAKSAAARLAAEPAVERSAASLPSAKAGWGAAVSPFAALSLGPSEAANNGEATALPWHTCHAASSAPWTVLNTPRTFICPDTACSACVPPSALIAEVVMQRWECWRHRQVTQAAASKQARRWWCRRCMAPRRGAEATSSSTRCAQGASVLARAKP